MPTTKTVRTKKATVSTAPIEDTTINETADVADAPAVVATAGVKTNVATKATTRKFDAEEMIEVRSITQGELVMPGRKSGILYRWSAFGDITEVEYQDLYTIKAMRSEYVYAPLFIIEDEELLADPKWKDVATLYESMYTTEDTGAVINLPLSQFKTALKGLPKGFLNAVKVEIATRIENGTFDSIQKIKAVDEICGTDFVCLIK